MLNVPTCLSLPAAACPSIYLPFSHCLGPIDGALLICRFGALPRIDRPSNAAAIPRCMVYVTTAVSHQILPAFSKETRPRGHDLSMSLLRPRNTKSLGITKEFGFERGASYNIIYLSRSNISGGWNYATSNNPGKNQLMRFPLDW